jgi:hypothetical protein
MIVGVMVGQAAAFAKAAACQEGTALNHARGKRASQISHKTWRMNLCAS